MKYSRWIAGSALAAGMAFPGATALSAQTWRADSYNRDGGERWEQRRDLRHDYARVEAMRADIARDQARLNEDIRCGRERQAARDAADLARDSALCKRSFGTSNAIARISTTAGRVIVRAGGRSYWVACRAREEFARAACLR
jgi:hypothetical protein